MKPHLEELLYVLREDTAQNVSNAVLLRHQLLLEERNVVRAAQRPYKSRLGSDRGVSPAAVFQDREHPELGPLAHNLFSLVELPIARVEQECGILRLGEINLQTVHPRHVFLSWKTAVERGYVGGLD